MSDTADEIEWYLARDGEQFGPLSDVEFKKVIELGHLRPDDLLWRAGMDDWQEAERIFPQTAAAPGDETADPDDVAHDEPGNSDAPGAAPDDVDADPAEPSPGAQEIDDPSATRDGAKTGTDIGAAEDDADPEQQALNPGEDASEPASEPEKDETVPFGALGVPAEPPPDDKAPHGASGPTPQSTMAHPTLVEPATPQLAAPPVAVPQAAAPQAAAPVGAVPPGPMPGPPPAQGQLAAGLEIPAPAPTLAQGRAPAGFSAQGQPIVPGRPHPPAAQLHGQPLTHAPRPTYMQGTVQPAPAPAQQRPAQLPGPGQAPAKNAATSGRARHVAVLTSLLLAVMGIVWLAYSQSHGLIPKARDLFKSATNSTAPEKADTKTVAIAKQPANPVIPWKPPAAAWQEKEAKVALLEPPKRVKPANPLQSSALWRYIETQFPDWYKKRAAEAKLLKAELPDNHAIIRSMDLKLVVLRRRYAKDALKASRPRLRAIASEFLNAVKAMAGHSVNACYGFISHGEFSPQVAPLLKSPQYSRYLDAQNLAVLKAVADGRRQAQAYQPPQPVDYRALGAELTSRGWSNADLQLFTDPVALSNAAPEKVCRMVQEWFAAQLALPDSDAQVRLLVQSLRPVIAG